MYSPRTSYLRILFLILLSGFPLFVTSQEVAVPDTIEYYAIFRGSDVQNNLNYALFTAASIGNCIGIEWLVRHGADVDARTMENVTPVIFAVASGEKYALSQLLVYHPDLDVISSYDESALMVAVKDNNMEIAELLLRDSALVDLQNKRGFTALHMSVSYGHREMTDMLLYYEANVNIRSNDGTTPLMVAAYSGYPDITDLLLQNRANVLDADVDGFTSLMMAAQNGDTLILDLLLNRGADIYAVNRYKYDALDLAIRMNYPEAVGYLLRKRKNMTAPGKGTVDPYAVASIYRRKEIIELLKKNNIPESSKRGFDQVSISVTAKFCLHDVYTGFSIAAKEPKYDLGIFAGFDIKPAWTRVLVKETDWQYYQYVDKSYIAYAGIAKEINISDNAFRGNWFFSGSFAAGYTFGNEFKGTNIKPDSKLRIIPYAGLRYNKNSFNFLIGLEYMNTEFYRIGPVWIRSGISFSIDLTNQRGSVKVIKW
jgi:uncharacterized protein